MSPRPYQLGQRQAASEQTRSRVLRAARELLMESTSFSGFSIEAVARRADVARMTVYHQFGSKIGLLEALCDSLAVTGEMEQLASAFRRPDPVEGLDEYIRIFGHFWEADRLVTRRLRGLAALDPDFEQVIRARDERRRKGLRVLVQRIVGEQNQTGPEALDEIVNVLSALLSFEYFEALAGPTRSLEDLVPLICRLSHRVLGMENNV
ncbi:MAG TPA: TetR/AcrR family transcriptional regulator [Ktedonobacteraceae bacterium]|nr:TetR/AcrR family transcriptional regulator [Ktedonobacteraceae bacterium]